MYTDPDIPPLPLHITFKQAKNYSTALFKGDPEELGIIKESVKGVVEGILPHKKEEEERRTHASEDHGIAYAESLSSQHTKPANS